MSGIAIYYERDHACIATDSLLTRADTRVPVAFVSKIFPIPTLRAVIAGTGRYDVLSNVAMRIVTGAVVRDVNNLAALLPVTIRSVADEVPNPGHEEPRGVGYTLYLFGVTAAGDSIDGWRFGSDTQVPGEATTLIPSVIARPQVPLDAGNAGDTFEYLEQIVRRQYQADQQRPFSERAGIGGPIQIVSLTLNRYFLQVRGPLPDYDVMLDDIIEQWPDNFRH